MVVGAQKPDDPRFEVTFDAEVTAPRPSRPASPDRTASAGDVAPRVNKADAVVPLYTGRLSPVPKGPAPQRDSSAPRNAAPPRASGIPGRTTGGRVLAVVVAIVTALVLGLAFVALFDRGPSHSATRGKAPVDELTWASIYDYFFTSGR